VLPEPPVKPPHTKSIAESDDVLKPLTVFVSVVIPEPAGVLAGV
jgi:hypothetical protein